LVSGEFVGSNINAAPACIPIKVNRWRSLKRTGTNSGRISSSRQVMITRTDVDEQCGTADSGYIVSLAEMWARKVLLGATDLQEGIAHARAN
jgi:hypothetical protein